MLVDRAVGIDLGTTNSEIAMLVPSERELLIYQDRFGRKTVPSAVAWDPQKEAFLVGRPARARRGKEPTPVESIKRRMGQTTKVACGPHSLSPEELSAKILEELKRCMQSFVDEKIASGVASPIRRAVITVPAYFDAPQVEATRRAGELAGLGVVGILQEPTAAAIYHTWKNRVSAGNFLVYDLGGGTFDVSILRCVGGEYQVLAIDGDNYLGGDDFDRRYAEHLRKMLSARGYKLELDVRNDPGDRFRFEQLVHLAQEIKESLSTTEVVSFAKEDLFEDQAGERIGFEAEISRADYEATIADLVDSTIACALRALDQSQKTAAVGLAEIDHVILVGGSTRVPLVRQRVIAALASKTKNTEPLADEVDTCVALGASVHAAQVGGLVLEDDTGRFRATFTSPLVTQSETLRLGLKVDEAPSECSEIAVTSSDAMLASAPLAAERHKPIRLEVSPPGAEDVDVALEARDAQGAALARLPFQIYRGEVRPRASALSRASVVAKDIGIEVVRAGRRERKVLIPRGTGLPTESTHVFFTADQSGAVVLRLLQGRIPINTLAVAVESGLAVGSLVELKLSCDETMRIEAKATVGGRELWARVESAAQVDFDKDGALEALLADAETLKRTLWGGIGEHVKADIDRLTASIREVVGTDPAKLQALCNVLRQLLDEYQGEPGDALTPPLAYFEAELDALRRVVYRVSGTMLGLDRASWEERIKELGDRGYAAHAAVDATEWRRVVNEVQALYETAIQEEYAGRRLDDPAHIERRLNNLSAYRTRLERLLSDFVFSPSPEVSALQGRETARLLSTIDKEVSVVIARLEESPPTDLHERRRRIEQAWMALERVETAYERLPSLGLVTERGSGSP